jgi:hypothetical protein
LFRRERKEFTYTSDTSVEDCIYAIARKSVLFLLEGVISLSDSTVFSAFSIKAQITVIHVRKSVRLERREERTAESVHENLIYSDCPRVTSSNDAKIKLPRSDSGLLGIFQVAIGGAVNRKRNLYVLRLEYSYEKFLL